MNYIIPRSYKSVAIDSRGCNEHDNLFLFFIIKANNKKYINNPPEGMTSKDIRRMSEEELLDMDYFLNDDELDDDFGEEGFYIF